MNTADFERRLALIRHRLDQLTEPLFEREDIEALLSEINRLQSCERALQSRERAAEDELRRNLGTMVQIKERLQLVMAENGRLTAFLEALKDEV